MTTSITKLQNKLEAAKKSTARAREKAGELMESALDAALTGGAAFALGVWEGRAPTSFKETMGVPAPLIVAAGAYAGMLLGVGRGMERHFQSVGNGALATHMAVMGRSIGTNWRTTAALPASAAASPASQAAGLASLVNR